MPGRTSLDSGALGRHALRCAGTRSMARAMAGRGLTVATAIAVLCAISAVCVLMPMVQAARWSSANEEQDAIRDGDSPDPDSKSAEFVGADGEEEPKARSTSRNRFSLISTILADLGLSNVRCSSGSAVSMRLCSTCRTLAHAASCPTTPPPIRHQQTQKLMVVLALWSFMMYFRVRRANSAWSRVLLVFVVCLVLSGCCRGCMT